MTREKILQAAKKLFEQKGFESTSVREIAALAGVNVALINYHFGSKELLLGALVEESTASVFSLLSDITKSSLPPQEKLDQALSVFVDKVFVNKQYYQMIHRELSTPVRPELNALISKPLKRNRDELQKIIEEGIRKKVFKKTTDVDLTISSIFGLMYQTTHIAFKEKVYDKLLKDDAVLHERLKIHLQNMLRDHLLRKN